jgi:acetyltransferase-like isoleucine patch superfamily enzyme
MIRKIIRLFITRLSIMVHAADAAVAKRTLPRFGNEPKGLRIDLPRRIVNPQRMRLGDDIRLGPGSFLMALTQYPTVSMQGPNHRRFEQFFDSEIVIGDRVTATGALQVTAHKKIIIENDVLFASNIFISDGTHGYETPREPYKYQPIWKISPIVIGEGSWVGQNVVILPGVTIGPFSIIGANSVVTKSIPGKCIAAGNPARVRKRWNEVEQAWVPV